MNKDSITGKMLRLLPPEMAHGLAINALKFGFVPDARKIDNPILATNLFGLDFPNPVGLAAGFDKNAESVNGLLKQGFGFIELGTVTPLQQSGNPTPRVFRLKEDEAVINRYGFNSLGIHKFAENLKKRKLGGIVGANIGKNKDSLDALHDYSNALAAVYDLVDYITVNISSPNTVGLRDLQQKNALSGLVSGIEKKRIELTLEYGKRKPILYKIAPDISEKDKNDIVQVAFDYKIDGLILTNTTISRPENLNNRYKNEKGGLSGRPLFDLSTNCLRDIYRISNGKIPLIGVGGISSAEDAYTKIKAGASLIQLYTALIYNGMKIVNDINEGLIKLLERDGFSHHQIQQAVGSDQSC
ncbi:MAG: quinone-dependent dihydroorotate dehydrogenase [Pseudomonadota bacterium]